MNTRSSVRKFFDGNVLLGHSEPLSDTELRLWTKDEKELNYFNKVYDKAGGWGYGEDIARQWAMKNMKPTKRARFYNFIDLIENLT